MVLTENLIEGLRQGDEKAQKSFYELTKTMLYGLCLRYMRLPQAAEDQLIETYLHIFKNIQSFKNEGSFEGWIKRITVNTCLMSLRKEKMWLEISDIDDHKEQDLDPSALDHIQYEELITLMQSLPIGYRTILNLYAIEGYKHREIADLLGISINTSKSQLIQARKKMIELITLQEKSGTHG